MGSVNRQKTITPAVKKRLWGRTAYTRKEKLDELSVRQNYTRIEYNNIDKVLARLTAA